MQLQKITMEFSVCKVSSLAHIDFSQDFIFLSKTDDEISVVCGSNSVPHDATAVESGWKALKILGVLDFGMIGIIARISAILADAKISLFAVSTYNTDYFFLKSRDYDIAVELLLGNGYLVQ